MTRATDNQSTPTTDNQAIVTAGSAGQQDLRHLATEELYAFYAELFSNSKKTASGFIAKLQQQLVITGLRYRL
jgi:hypothetical protein